jgi:hypothetical protein
VNGAVKKNGCKKSISDHQTCLANGVIAREAPLYQTLVMTVHQPHMRCDADWYAIHFTIPTLQNL